MSWRTTSEIAWSELGVGSLVPASGASGLALGAWVLHRAGMETDKIARRSVAFFILKSSVNFVAVFVIGGLLWLGVIGPSESFALSGLPALGAALVIGLVVALPHIARAPTADETSGRVRRFVAGAWRAVVDGAREAFEIVRHGNVPVIAGSIGYWAFDNAVLWACFHAYGDVPPLTVILLGYLIGQMGGLLPLPGGVGGIDGGLIGMLILYGADPATTAAAVFTYRLILFWLPLIGGAIAFWLLRRNLDRPELCVA
jgi:uncharacterized membrane protein YbhN (UPF0104 family)